MFHCHVSGLKIQYKYECNRFGSYTEGDSAARANHNRMSAPLRLAALLGLLLLVSAEDFQLGGDCNGEVLFSQTASTKSDSGSSYVVAYGGDPGVNISCIITQDVSPNTTVSTLLSGGPGRRYAVLRVEAVDASDADFTVNIFGTGQSLNRVSRATDDDCSNEPPPKDQPPLEAAADDIGKMSTRLRKTADRLDAIEKVIRFVGKPLGGLT